VLTVRHKRYIEICLAKRTNPSRTNMQLAADFGISRSLVDRAFRYGQEHDIFAVDILNKVQTHISELRTLLGKLEKAFAKHSRKPRGVPKGWKPNATDLTRLSREIRETRMLIMELEGLYKHTLSVQHGGSIGTQVVVYVPDNARDAVPSTN